MAVGPALQVLPAPVAVEPVITVLAAQARKAKASSAVMPATGAVPGMKEFKAKYARAKPCLIGGQGMPPEMFFSREADEFF